MRIERHYTKPENSPYAEIAFRTTKSEIRNPDGSIVFSADGIEVPSAWSQVAADVLAQKYFRRAGVPARLKRIEEAGVPAFLWRSVADEEALAALPKSGRERGETSAAQVFQAQLISSLRLPISRDKHRRVAWRPRIPHRAL